MTFAKKDVFGKEHREIAEFARVVSHPARVAILDFLANQTSCVSGDISNEIPLSRPTVSQHLQELKKFGLIHGKVSGKRVYYCLKTDKLKEIGRKINEWLDRLTEQEIICNID